MLYHAYELQRAWLSSASAMASIGASLLNNPANPWGYVGLGPMAASALDVFAHATANYDKPAFGITEVVASKKSWQVEEATVVNKPFGDLKRFRHEGLSEDAPSLLIVAPMSGHYATLLRGTVERMLESCEVYITDWADAKTVPLHEGSFDLDDYIDYVIEFLGHIHQASGQRPHMMAVCQPSVPAFAATALMNLHKDPATPATLTMMGGPIDTRESPTTVNDLAMERPIEWFRQTVIATVPMNHRGAGRKVYPGFLQLTGFMTMNLDRHIDAHKKLYEGLIAGDGDSTDGHRKFYDEYLSVLDLTSEYYLQTLEVVFQTHALPKGEMTFRWQTVDPGKIKDTAILCVEGELDDISGVGQTKAALDITPNLPKAKKHYHLEKGVGHYGVFNGRKWRENIAPVVKDFMRKHAGPPAKV